MPTSGALASAKFLRVGIRGYAFSVFVGVILGFGCAWIMQKVGGLVHAHLKQNAVSVQERYLRLLYFGALAWIVFGLFLGSWVTPPLLRLFRL
jgi:Na+-driven multidrug efflux pump